MEPSTSILKVAEDVLRILQAHKTDAIVIGAVALAAHHYVRQTDDLDLGVNAGTPTLRTLAAALREAGFTTELREPDARILWVASST